MDILWKIQRKTRKYLTAHSHDPRSASYPYISGDGFRALAGHIHESGKENPDGKGRSFDPAKVKEGSIVFVQTDLIEDYFSKIHPHIVHPYKLITHNSDRNITKKDLRFINEKIIRWFAQNVLVEHPKLTPIPIGLENLHYYNFGEPKVFNKIKEMGVKNESRKNRILFGFNIQSNIEERTKAFAALSQSKVADHVHGWPVPMRYLETVRSYAFVASPRGNGEDCIRTWEAMQVGTVPIVQRSAGIESFKDLGLPMLIIDSWDEIAGISEYELREKYDLIMSSARQEALIMDYWQNLITSTK